MYYLTEEELKKHKKQYIIYTIIFVIFLSCTITFGVLWNNQENKVDDIYFPPHGATTNGFHEDECTILNKTVNQRSLEDDTTVMNRIRVNGVNLDLCTIDDEIIEQNCCDVNVQLSDGTTKFVPGMYCLRENNVNDPCESIEVNSKKKCYVNDDYWGGIDAMNIGLCGSRMITYESRNFNCEENGEQFGNTFPSLNRKLLTYSYGNSIPHSKVWRTGQSSKISDWEDKRDRPLSFTDERLQIRIGDRGKLYLTTDYTCQVLFEEDYNTLIERTDAMNEYIDIAIEAWKYIIPFIIVLPLTIIFFFYCCIYNNCC